MNAVNISVAAELWRDEQSASRIAKQLGVTRSTILGIAYRNRQLFPRRRSRNEHFFTSRSGPGAPPLSDYDRDRLASAKLLHELKRHQCRWPLNDGGPYLFCAAETTGSYCEHHAERSRARKIEVQE